MGFSAISAHEISSFKKVKRSTVRKGTSTGLCYKTLRDQGKTAANINSSKTRKGAKKHESNYNELALQQQMIFLRYVFFLLLSLLIVVLIINFYFMNIIINNSKLNINTSIKKISEKKYTNSRFNYLNSKILTVECIQKNIIKKIEVLPSKYFQQNVNYTSILDNIILELQIIQNANNDTLRVLKTWTSARQLIPSFSPELGTIIELLRHIKIIKADTAKVGTQLKLFLTFQNGLTAIFKPQWYSRTTKIEGPVYYGKDRHNAEVVAFYLALLLSIRRVPLALIRKLQLKEEIEKNATPELLSTIYKNGDNTCFYGVCHYCSPIDSVCGVKDLLEGTVLLWLPQNWKLTKYKHPWQRTYTNKYPALWEVDTNYCNKVKLLKTYSAQSSNRLLDLIDTAIFDFLIDNGDRHHYELLKDSFEDPAVLLIDNGKSLGNPDIDHIDILAPLYQCCIVRKTTWDRLQLLSGGSLSYALKKLLAHESSMADVLPIITDKHLSAIDRRLLTVYAIVEYCLNKTKNSPVIK